MKRLTERLFTSKYGCLLLLISLAGCAATPTKYQREYAKVWKELIKTQAWQESLLASRSNGAEELYASTDNEFTPLENRKAEADFKGKYQTLVSRAYFKIITEAEKADARISSEYQLLQEGQLSSTKDYKKKVHEITKKYDAHKAMLSGLKSWNIFSEDRSGDLEYFKAENEEAVQKMVQAGETENTMVNYLIYKLADLYHVEDN